MKPDSYDSEDDPEFDLDGHDVDYDAMWYVGLIAPKTRPDKLDDYSLSHST